jgi:hypothetical protein
VWNNYGELLVAGVGKINYAASALHTEAMAAYKGLLFCFTNGHAVHHPGDGLFCIGLFCS